MTVMSADPRSPSVIVWGYGSIGQRHARILAALGCRVSVVSRRSISEYPCHATIATALAASAVQYCVIATPTADHPGNLADLAGLGFSGRVLVEKPLGPLAAPGLAHRFSGLHVGYNLRFHPVVQAARTRLGSRPAFAATWRVGQYLPDWRPGTDYRQGYAAQRDAGGGALRDLSHEIDLALWFFPRWQRLVALTGRVSPLEIATEDCASILAVSERCPQLSLHLNYLDRVPVRQFIITAPDLTLVGDLVRGSLTANGETSLHSCERDESYRRQHEAVLAGDETNLCDLSAGGEVMSFIDAAERSAAGNLWINRP
jgi:predicted dehydrogenase